LFSIWHVFVGIRKTIAALRGIERWEPGDLMQQAFTGFIALPSNSSWEIRGRKPSASTTEIETTYRDKAKRWHPERGGFFVVTTKSRQGVEPSSSRPRFTRDF